LKVNILNHVSGVNEMNAIDEKFAQIHSEIPSTQTTTHFHVYQNLNFVSELQFEKDRITIGRSQQADLFLDHRSVADIHALVNVKGAQMILTNRFPQNGLRLNGLPVHSALLKHEDVIVIGPFSLKIKMREGQTKPAVSDDASYAVRLVNRYNSPEAMDTAIANLAKMFHVDCEKIKPLVGRNHFVLKKGLSGIEAAQIQNTMLRAGVVCDVQIADPPPTPLKCKAPLAEAPPIPLSDEPDEKRSIPETVTNKEVEHLPSDFFPVDEEEDEDGEIWEAPFSLNQVLFQNAQPEEKGDARIGLQIVKTMGDAVVDAVSLEKSQKYHIQSDGARICLVNHHLSGATVTIPASFGGVVLDQSGVITADLNSYKINTYQNPKDRSIFDVPMPDKGAIVIDGGGCRYRIDRVQRFSGPDVDVAPAPKYLQWQHWALSLGIHFFLVMVITITAYFQTLTPEKQKLHFVKIDRSMLQQQMEVPKKKPELKKQPPPERQPQKKAEAVKPPQKQRPKKKVTPAVKIAKKSRRGKKVARVPQASKHPKAGGGFGEGNIKNRDINQTGLLSVLGGPSIAESSQAMAAVTNLDAVSVPGATEKNFSVGGLKGALGNGRIAVATGEIVQTKGATQVLRSAGARGKGDVAALERGTTGKKRVQAMVTAKMNRTVKIEGGMSREMVKRVIDQHLDEITYCYETALMSNPSILGRMVFEWKILKNGRVGEIRIVASSVNSNQIHGCIKSAIKSWQFPKPVGTEVVVSYPFVFDLVSF